MRIWRKYHEAASSLTSFVLVLCENLREKCFVPVWGWIYISISRSSHNIEKFLMGRGYVSTLEGLKHIHSFIIIFSLNNDASSNMIKVLTFCAHLKKDLLEHHRIKYDTFNLFARSFVLIIIEYLCYLQECFVLPVIPRFCSMYDVLFNPQSRIVEKIPRFHWVQTKT